MAAYGWQSEASVREWLCAESWRFEFFQAVRLVEAALAEDGADGEVRFSSHVSMSFPASEVREVRFPGNGDAPRMDVQFLGLSGALGPLPPPVAELVIDRARRKDYVLRDFLDIFNHRLVSLFFEVRRELRAGFELCAHPSRSRFAGFLFALLGMGTDGMRSPVADPSLSGRVGVPDGALAGYAAAFAQRQRSMSGLERVVSGHFGVRVEGIPFLGGWMRLEPEDITRIGRSGRNAGLSRGAVLGTRVWDRSTAFDLRLGPLVLNRYLTFLPLPENEAFTALCGLVRFYAGSVAEYGIRLVLARGEVPECRLGSAQGALLGWASWLGFREKGGKDPEVRLPPRLADRGRREVGCFTGAG